MFITSHNYVTFLSTYSEVLAIHIAFQWNSSQEERGEIIYTGLLDPTPEISRVITEAEAVGKGIFLQNIHTPFKSNSTSYIRFSRFKPFSVSFINSHMQILNQQTVYPKWLLPILTVFYLKPQRSVMDLSTTFVNHC